MKYALLALLLTACCQIPQPGYRTEDRAIAQLAADGFGMCTTFHVGGGVWATASHCVRGEHVYTIRDQIATVLYDNDASVEPTDVALLLGPSGGAVLRLGSSTEFGQALHYIGYPQYRGVHHGVYTGIAGGQDGNGLIEFTGEATGGASGSPVMDDDGNVVGILVGSWPSLPFSSFVPVSSLRAVLLEVARA